MENKNSDGSSCPPLPIRKRLYHAPPSWVQTDEPFFITVCCAERGRAQLNRPAVFAVMTGAIEHYVTTGRWWVECFLAMPDHWHALIAFPEQEQMERILRDWKRYVAKQSGIVWQDGFFDHRLRSAKKANETWQYIEQNPVRKGLCGAPEDWPWKWPAADKALGTAGRARYP